MNDEDWSRCAGIICPRCNRESFRMVEGVCFSCYSHKIMKKEENMEDHAMKDYYRRALREGTVSLVEMREGRLGTRS